MANHQYLGIQVKEHEGQAQKFRKAKKALSAKRRQAQKNGNDLSEMDVRELERLTGEANAVQKTLEGLRKQFRSHGNLMQDFKAKQNVSRDSAIQVHYYMSSCYKIARNTY